VREEANIISLVRSTKITFTKRKYHFCGSKNITKRGIFFVIHAVKTGMRASVIRGNREAKINRAGAQRFCALLP
jgi:hypothetical protein